VAQVERRGHDEQAAERLGERGRVVRGLGHLKRDTPQLRRQRGAPVAVAVLGLEPRAQVLGRLAVAVVLEHARKQLLGRLDRLDVELLVLIRGQHEPRLQLEQRRDQDQELGGRLEVELTRALEVLDVGEHDLREVHLEEVDLLLQHERQEQVERPVEDLQVEVERGD
jgi:hypothetical protein